MLKSNMLKSILMVLCIGLMPVFVSSCSDDEEPLLEGHGIVEAEWSDVNDADLDGATLVYEFMAPAAWTATCSDDWCIMMTESGVAGLSSLRIKVAPNEGQYGRSTTVNIQTEGYSEPCVLTIRQGEGFLEKGDGVYREINNWIYDRMSTYYLWNEKIPELTLDYSLDYQRFLTSILDGVAAYDDVNHDDGAWANGSRQNYYTYIESNAPISRAVGTPYTDSGIMITATILGTSDDAPCGFAVLWVTPGSPADKEGVKRGDFISTVNKIAVTQNNYQSLGSQVFNGNVTIDLNDVEFVNGVPKITPRVPSVLVGKDSYVDPSIYKWDVVKAPNGKNIGYLLYMGFHTAYDKQLIDVFNEFKAKNIDELIIDLRYNNGGHVLSSTLLGTLVAGAHTGDIYVRTIYNASRTAAGEVGEYRIGEAANPENNGYSLIPEALTSSLNLSQIYVIGSGSTASASELLINGLRGMDVDVNLIGTTTHGKNVGMEGWMKTAGNYQFLFYPITFYCENAKGFRDYSEGFIPDLIVDDSNIYPGEFGTTRDLLTNYAIQWASTGVKPETKGSRAADDNVKVLKSSAEMMTPLTRKVGGSIMMRN